MKPKAKVQMLTFEDWIGITNGVLVGFLAGVSLQIEPSLMAVYCLSAIPVLAFLGLLILNFGAFYPGDDEPRD